MSHEQTIALWKKALEQLGVGYADAPSFVPTRIPALLVLNSKNEGTIVFFATLYDQDRVLRQRADEEGYGWATGFTFDDPSDLAEVLEEWGF